MRTLQACDFSTMRKASFSSWYCHSVHGYQSLQFTSWGLNWASITHGPAWGFKCMRPAEPQSRTQQVYCFNLFKNDSSGS